MNEVEERSASLHRGEQKVGGATSALSNLFNSIVPLLGLAVAVAAIMLALVALTRNDMEAYPVPLLAAICVVLELQFVDTYRQHSRWDFGLLIVSALAFLLLLALRAMPEYLTGLQLNAVIHRSIFSSIFLLVAALPTLVFSTYYLLDATPAAEDISKYPLILLPVLLIVALYFILLWKMATQGLQAINWSVFITPFKDVSFPVKYYILGDWPAWKTEQIQSIGMGNHILGTGLLILLTSVISMPIGVGTGIFLSEYGEGRLANVIRFITSSLRAISMLIVALAAFSLANAFNNTPLEGMFRGVNFSGWLWYSSTGGSYVSASLALSIVIIPVIVRVTEEGCRSLPQDLREGSLALGVSEETTLRRIVFPWALPNILTGWLLGCAEAAGSVAVLLFVAGRGMYGVGLDKQVTSLAYLIFDIYYGEPTFKGYMQFYQFQAGVLLLIITLLLGILAILSKDWLGKKFRGG
ncbi:MAG TPA: ABC transporter permease subunit [Anaerolineales bacterium]|nr:ABC transporter permease subunit [Anaerolineales bacterium]